MTFADQNTLSESTKRKSRESTSLTRRRCTRLSSEDYLGRWIRDRSIPRDSVVLATKVTGPSGQMTWIRDGPRCLMLPISLQLLLDALGRAVDAGKVRYVGLSNQTAYGVMKFLQAAERGPGFPKIVSVQNSYSLLCRIFDSGLAESCHHERVSLLAYSPLAMGILSGKIPNHDIGAKSHRILFPSAVQFRWISDTSMCNAEVKEHGKHGLLGTI